MTQGKVMDIERLLLQRRTVNEYADEPVPEGVVQQALKAAMAGPNHKMTEPWRFTRVGRQTRERLAYISVELKRAKAPEAWTEKAEAKVRQKILNPAELIVVRQVLDDDAEVRREDYAAIACGVENLMLWITAAGYGAKWSTGAVTSDRRTYEHLGIDSGVEWIAGFIWVGVPADTRQAKPKRKLAVDDVVTVLP